jgi:photosystem II stability/assembly factor-like uncharacterized protein
MLYIGTDDGIYRWRHGTPWPVFHSLQGRGIVDLVSPGGGTLVAVDNAGRAWETLDNGQSWQELSLPSGAERPTASAIVGAPGALVMATRPLGLALRAIGPNAPVRRRPNPLAVAESRAAALLSRGARTLAARARGGTAVAEPAPPPPAPAPDLDGWTALGVPAVEPGPAAPPAIRALVPGQGVWFAAVVGAGLWRSTDGGRTWAACPGLPAEVYAIRMAPKPEGLVALATSDGCWISTDHGQTWEDRSGGLEKARHLRALEIKPGNPNYLLAGATPVAPGEGPVAPRGGLQFALYESKDGGKTWVHVRRGFPEVLEFDTITDIRFDPSDTDYAVVALASGELWSTRSDGLWWEPLARQIHAARVLCVTS